mgnify:CR=1 FL=1
MSRRENVPISLNLPFVEELQQRYASDPESLPSDWRAYFDGLAAGNGHASPRRTQPAFKPRSIFHRTARGNGAAMLGDTQRSILQDRLDQLIRAYRVRGHIIAQIDPLGLNQTFQPELDPDFYGFNEDHLDMKFSCRTIYAPQDFLTLREIIQRLHNTYCRSIGAQFMHIDQLGVRHWLQERMEGTENRIALSREEQVRIYTRLTDAVIFEEFVQKKFVGAKSFSLQGSESLIPLLDLAIERAGEHGIEEIVLGMAHRGRLNVLANIIGKSPKEVFREFEDIDADLHTGRGDVKYHLGYSSDWTTLAGKKVHLSLCFNPSHLEYVNTVALGRIRAKQNHVGDFARERGMVILIHGDAAFAGEGIVQETLNLSQLPGYSTGGTLHVIVNNQIGFTTSPSESRSSMYASGLAKMLQVPIFHVNGEDPEAVAQTVQLAMDFRKTFKRDVVIDMYGYRRLGHNEGDEPSFTQPVLYKAIKERKSVRDGYLEHLLTLGGVTQDEAEDIAEQRHDVLEFELNVARSDFYVRKVQSLEGIWQGYVGGPESNADEVDTGVAKSKLSELLVKQTELPDDFHLHPKLGKLMEYRKAVANDESAMDWATAESLAFASLAVEGHEVRLSGQDSGRGTFSQRHAVLYDYEDGHPYTPMQHLEPDQAPLEIINSPLSEAGVLGFDYGYSLDSPNGLIMWEAQFGDFCNAAQVIIDQFIASAEDKWRRLSSLVMLLPHGFEGQGPEHSSARLERFLMLAAEHNIQIAQPTTPAQHFHLLRRQAKRKWKKPLIVMTPKSLLRHSKVVSPLDELENGEFKRILPDESGTAPEKIKKILLCSGKLYYELAAEREEKKRSDVAIIRIEQFYPLAPERLAEALAPYNKDAPVRWVQEEPENMGGWRFFGMVFGNMLRARGELSHVTRGESASPATGSAYSQRCNQRARPDRAVAEGAGASGRCHR